MESPLTDPPLKAFTQASGDDARNRLLREWISDDADRALLFKLINDRGGELVFPSRDAGPRDCDCWGLETPRPQPVLVHKPVCLVTDRSLIEEMLLNKEGKYSNRVYAELGGGNFMLALDPRATDGHRAQREAYHHCFSYADSTIAKLSHFACEAAAIMSLRAPEFDLALFAEQAALRFCQKLMGYALTDYRLLETAMRAGYRALVYQVLGRHFVTDPTAIPAGKMEMGRLLRRTSELIDAYAVDDEDALKGTKDRAVPDGFAPVMSCLGKLPGDLNGEHRAIIAAGAALGTVGNVQAAACIAVQSFFRSDDLFNKARALAQSDGNDRETLNFSGWQKLIQDSLRENPPIPFLPRLEIDEQGNATREFLLALGGGTQGNGSNGGDDPLIWGLPLQASHWCAGQALAWPLIVEIVRQVMRLPALEERLDPEDATVIGLKKRWGFACESYPLTHRRDRRVAQASLNVAMRLKSPVKDNADRAREVIRSGAPRIEEALRDARHVHFAWFELIESDTVLVLHTVYDGPFSAYIQDFALKVGDLFDALFECIENPPPMPVDKFPNDFVAHIQRHDRAPAMGYFFSAYPHSEVAHILRNETNDGVRP